MDKLPVWTEILSSMDNMYPTNISSIADKLHITKSHAHKKVKALSAEKYLDIEKIGRQCIVKLTAKGNHAKYAINALKAAGLEVIWNEYRISKLVEILETWKWSYNLGVDRNKDKCIIRKTLLKNRYSFYKFRN